MQNFLGLLCVFDAIVSEAALSMLASLEQQLVVRLRLQVENGRGLDHTERTLQKQFLVMPNLVRVQILQLMT
jgi:hypothetical protein